MRKIGFLALLCLMAGCTTTGDIRRQCAMIADSFAGEVACFEAAVAQEPGMAGDSFVQEYLLAGRVLAENVAAGRISENEARLQLTRDYNNLLLRQQQYDAYNAINMERLRPRHTTCYPAGNGSMVCDTY